MRARAQMTAHLEISIVDFILIADCQHLFTREPWLADVRHEVDAALFLPFEGQLRWRLVQSDAKACTAHCYRIGRPQHLRNTSAQL